MADMVNSTQTDVEENNHDLLKKSLSVLLEYLARGGERDRWGFYVFIYNKDIQ